MRNPYDRVFDLHVEGGFADDIDVKKAEYQAAGILAWEQSGGENGTLIETRDDERGALDAAKIAALIDRVLAV